MNFGIDMEQLLQLLEQTKQKGTRVLGLVSIKRLGLRYRFNHCFVEYCSNCKSTHDHDLREIALEIKDKMKEYKDYEK